MSSNNIYTSPLCSCIICRKEYSAKGIHSHFKGAHGTPEEKSRFTGKGQSRAKQNSHDKQKEKAENLRFVYASNPNRCTSCNTELNYEKRNNTYCSHSCSAKETNLRRNKEVYERVSVSNKGIEPSNKWLQHTKVSQCKICLKWFPGANRKTCNVKECKYKTRKGKCGGYRANSTNKTRSIYGGSQMDSGAELKFAKLLDKYGIKWWKNDGSIKFEFVHPAGTNNYIPDFYLHQFDIWIEIKGKYYYNEKIDPYKWKAVKNLEVIWSNDIKLPAVCTSHDLVLED